MSHYTQALPAQAAAGATVATLIGTVEVTDDAENYIYNLSLTPPAGFTTVTGVATNNVTFNFRQLRAGAVVTTIASITLAAGTNLVAETPLYAALPTFSTGSALPYTLLRGDVLDVQMVQNGTGLAVGAGVLAQFEL